MIKIESVTKYFKQKNKKIIAVNNVSLTVKQGDMLGLIGVNGSGKSTLIKMMNGILYPDQGEIIINGKNPWKHQKEIAYQIGSIFGQKSQLWYHLTPRETFMFLGSVYSVKLAALKLHVAELIQQFDLHSFVDRPVRKLSLGQRMKCEIVASLVHNPSILFLDEPTIGLDLIAKDSLTNLLSEYNKVHNKTMVITTHDISDIAKLCNRVVIIDQGVIIYNGTTIALTEKFANIVLLEIVLASDIAQLPIEVLQHEKSDAYTHKIKINTDKIAVSEVFNKLEIYEIIRYYQHSLDLTAIVRVLFEEGVIDDRK